MLKSAGTGARTLAIASLAALGITGSAFGADSNGPCSVRKEANVPAKMRDGSSRYGDEIRARNPLPMTRFGSGLARLSWTCLSW